MKPQNMAQTVDMSQWTCGNWEAWSTFQHSAEAEEWTIRCVCGAGTETNQCARQQPINTLQEKQYFTLRARWLWWTDDLVTHSARSHITLGLEITSSFLFTVKIFFNMPFSIPTLDAVNLQRTQSFSSFVTSDKVKKHLEDNRLPVAPRGERSPRQQAT